VRTSFNGSAEKHKNKGTDRDKNKKGSEGTRKKHKKRKKIKYPFGATVSRASGIKRQAKWC